MELKIVHLTSPKLHRNSNIKSLIMNGREVINGINVVVLQTEDEQWWIAPEKYSDDTRFEDLGPFSKPDEAMIHLRLVMDAK